MNKVLFIITFFLSVSMIAQQAKPTKEQTIEYITNYFKKINGVHHVYEEAAGYFSCSRYYQYKNFKIAGNILSLEVVVTDKCTGNSARYDQYTERTEINLATIESLSYNLFAPQYLGSIILYTANKAKTIAVHNTGTHNNKTYFTDSYILRSDEPITENSQIFKAFDHLRKLSGAPEPLQF